MGVDAVGGFFFFFFVFVFLGGFGVWGEMKELGRRGSKGTNDWADGRGGYEIMI